MAAFEKEIEAVVDSILSDYQLQRPIDEMTVLQRPDRDVVVDMIEKLRRIIFPGYFRDKNFRIYNAKHNVSMLIEDVLFHLNRQLTLVFESAGEEKQVAQEHAEGISLAFFRQIPQIRALVQTDLEAAFAGDPAASNHAEIIYAYPGLFAITVFRLAHELHALGAPLLPRIMTEYAHSITGIDIHPGATIGKFFFIDHGTGIVVGETTVIGDYVKLYQGVTLGALSTRGGQSLRGKRRHPTIEDRVTIYAGASVLGGDTVVGAGSVIGSNAFITESIAPGTVVTIKNQELQFKTRSGEKTFWNE